MPLVFDALLIILVTGIASAFHGWDDVDKIIPTVVLGLFYPALLWLDGFSYYSIAGVSLPLVWRWFLRGGKQAEAELNAMDTWNRPMTGRKRRRSVWAAYYYLPTAYLLGWLIDTQWSYDHVPPNNHGSPFWGARRRIELFAGLLVQGPVMVLLYWLLEMGLEVLL